MTGEAKLTCKTLSLKTKVLLLGSGELGKEVVIELKRLGVYVIAVDRYENAPGMQVADEYKVIDMTNFEQLRNLILSINPDYIVPEIEAINIDALLEINKLIENGKSHSKIVPSFRAVSLTMNREGIRRLAAEELGIKTSNYRFAVSYEELVAASNELGFPVVIKPIQSSSGKGQSIAKNSDDLQNSWNISQTDARGGGIGVKKIIVESFVDFDYEITLLTCKSTFGIVFCEPIGHLQVDGDYRTSWQPQNMSENALKNAQNMAKLIVNALTPNHDDFGIFGVELFVKGDEIIFSEVSPRPHDTGMVTLITQIESEFKMHAKSILGLPVLEPVLQNSGASHALIAKGFGMPIITNTEKALANQNVDIRIFGKPEVNGERRIGVLLSSEKSTDIAIKTVEDAAKLLNISCE